MRRWRKGFLGGSRAHQEAKAHQDARFEPRFDDAVDELLELAWMLDEERITSVQELGTRAGDRFEDVVEAAQSAGMLRVVDGVFSILPPGRERAREIIRRHRLTETLLTEVLEMDEKQAESDACRFEHILSPEVTESVCTLLGHPPACPHGKPIPRGRCCEKFQKELSPLVMPLAELHPGETARIVFMTPKSHARLDRLASLGIVPGSTIRLHQRHPTCVIRLGETDVAIDINVAREIFVKRV